ncbi:MAG: type 4a pilus biogenesis protein PilO [Candidatus Omnitrophota bacterium]|nr:general secretion pathway protein GspB [Candidatus Omnitrophota bacterium]
MIGNIEEIIRVFKHWYNKLQLKERRLFVVGVIIFFCFFYFNFFLKPLLRKISAHKMERERVDDSAKLLISQFPDLDKSNQELKDIRANIAAMEFKIGDIKAKLLNVSDVPRLLSRLIECARGLKIDFQSVKQEVVTDKEGFAKLFIDLEFESNYETAVNYIKNIEEMSSFVKIEEVDIAQSKVDPRNLVGAALKLSALLSSAPKSGAEPALTFEKKEEGIGKVSINRSPLAPKFSTGKVKKKALELNGITYRGKQSGSSAIINNSVVKTGDMIEEDYKVEAILSDSVIINDGIETQVLNIER